VPTTVLSTEGNIDGRPSASAGSTRRGWQPWYVLTFSVRKPGDPVSNQAGHRTCRHWEVEEP
jgi:hypothetical protein